MKPQILNLQLKINSLHKDKKVLTCLCPVPFLSLIHSPAVWFNWKFGDSSDILTSWIYHLSLVQGYFYTPDYFIKYSGKLKLFMCTTIPEKH